MDDAASTVGTDDVEQLLADGSRGIWVTTALALAAEHSTPSPVRGAAEQVLRTVGAGTDTWDGLVQGPTAGSRAATALLQAADALRSGAQWSSMPDDVLIDQGRASAGGAVVLIERLVRRLPGLAEALGRPGAAMLDVGTGTGALAVAYARALPNVHVLGLDVLPRALDIARRVVAASDVAARVTLRQQDVADLDEPGAFDLVWVPAPFIPPDALQAGVRAAAGALRPGGWLVMGHGKFGKDPLADAVTGLQTAIYGGTAVDDRAAQELLSGAGLRGVSTAATPAGAPAITVGQRIQD